MQARDTIIMQATSTLFVRGLQEARLAEFAAEVTRCLRSYPQKQALEMHRNLPDMLAEHIPVKSILNGNSRHCVGH